MANIDYAELLQTDAWVNNDRRYPSPSQLSEWFLGQMRNHDMFATVGNLNAEVSDKVELKANGSEDKLLTYQKGMVSLVSPFSLTKDSILPEANYTVGIIWSYVGKTPIIKVYRGANVMACTNMLIMGADDVKTLKLKPISKGITGRRAEVQWERTIEDLELSLEDTARDYQNELDVSHSDLVRFQSELFNNTLDEQQMKNVIADMTMLNYEFEFVNTYTWNFGMAAMLSPNQNHRIYQMYNLKEEGNNRMWTIYNAFTQHLSTHKTEIDSKPEKVLGVTNLIKVVSGMSTVDELVKNV